LQNLKKKKKKKKAEELWYRSDCFFSEMTTEVDCGVALHGGLELPDAV